MRALIVALVLVGHAFGQAAPQILFNNPPVGFSGYLTQKTITFPASASGTLTNVDQAFTAAVSGIQHTVVPFASFPSAPADFILTTDATCGSIAGVTGWDVEFYNGTTVIGHVGLPSLTTGASVVLFACWNNASVSTWQGGARGSAYDANTGCVFHLPDGSTPNFVDFSGNAENGTNTLLTAAAGEIDGGVANATAAGDFSFPSGCAPTPNSAITFSLWAKPTAFAASQFVLLINGGTPIYMYLDTSAHLNMAISGLATGSTTLSAGTFYGLSGTFAGGTGNLIVYVNGVADSSPTASIATWTSGTVYAVGANGSLGLIGSADEVRLDNIARTAGWLRTKYLNESSPPAAM